MEVNVLRSPVKAYAPFYNNGIDGNFGPSVFSDSYGKDMRWRQGPTIFFEDNQWQPLAYRPAPRRDEPIEIDIEEYRGFAIDEWGELTVKYHKAAASFSHDFKVLCLRKTYPNELYHEPYLIVCFELELEGIGGSKDTALEHLHQLLDIYFNQTRVLYPKADDYLAAIAANIDAQNTWKQSFAQRYKRARKEDAIINGDYHYQIKDDQD